MTNLENLRKQARQLVRWHHQHNYAVASRIRAALPRYHWLSDEQILPNARTKPVLTQAEPQLFVSDINAACAYFEQKLGFTVVFTHGDPPFYGQIRRDHVSLNLRFVGDPVFNGTVREDDQLLATVIAVENVKALYSEYAAAEVEFQQTLRRQPWGAHQFVVRDPDGNLILFGGQ